MREGKALGMDVHRLDRLRARVREADLAAAVLVQPPNLRYLTGFHSNAYSRPLALVVPAEGGPTLIVPRLEETQAREMTSVADLRSYVEWDEGSAAGGRLDAEWRARAEYLPMRTGHGLGLAPVEAPNLGAGDETPLRPGMVISIEPGVCIPGAGGVLWADNYVVTGSGVEPLTAYPIEAEFDLTR